MSKYSDPFNVFYYLSGGDRIIITLPNLSETLRGDCPNRLFY